MKKLIYLSLLILSIASCKKDNEYDYDNFNLSLYKWRMFKAAINNTYTYTTIAYTPSTFAAYQTTITVTNGKVTKREYKEGTTTYTEVGTAIGSHTFGTSPYTLDEVYEMARTTWLKPKLNRKHKVVFKVDDNGLIAEAWSEPVGVEDSNFFGIIITSIVAK